MAGGAQRDNITGADQLLLTICIFIHPEASLDEIAAFVHSNGGDLYTRSKITDKCADLQFTRKRGSRESYDAFYPVSLRRLHWYKTEAPPLGICGVPTHRMIDINETSFCLKSCARRYWRGHKTSRVRYPQHYRRNKPKLNVLLACEAGNENIPANMDGSIQRPQIWIRVTQSYVDQFIFGGFINEILTNIEEHPVIGGYDDE